MKTRIVKTRMWSEDDDFGKLSVIGRYGFVYLIANSRVGMTNYYECPDRVIMFEMGITAKQLEEIKEELLQAQMAAFFDGWVYVPNLEKHNNYKNGEKNIKAYDRELLAIPTDIKESLDSTMILLSPKADSSHKSKTRNKKPEIKDQEPEKEQGFKLEEIAQAFIQRWNQIHGTKYTAWQPITKNLLYWLGIYQPEQILEAITNLKHDKFWKDKMTPIMMLRRRNPNREEVDYIGGLIHNGRTAGEEARKKKIIL